jgi:p-aminobenzoyl-glutamate transporter AbgT
VRAVAKINNLEEIKNIKNQSVNQESSGIKLLPKTSILNKNGTKWLTLIMTEIKWFVDAKVNMPKLQHWQTSLYQKEQEPQIIFPIERSSRRRRGITRYFRCINVFYKMANVLREQGVKKGDHASIYR